MKNIFITRKIDEVGLKMLEEKGYSVDVRQSDSIPTQEEIIESLNKKEYDAVVTLLTDKIDLKVFDAVPNVKLYVNYATGFDNMDITEAKNRDITICNAPAVITSEAVAEHTLALMLALAARIVEADEFVRQGKYDGWSPSIFIGTDVLGKTLGLVGAGRIGSRVGFYAKALGMKVIYYDVSRNEQIEKECGAEYCESLDDLLQKADIVSIHVPLLPTTKHLINWDKLNLMKKTAFLINTSRGPVVEEVSLTKALSEGVIAGAGLDVFEFEPKISGDLIKLQNTILTPHIASASVEARVEMSQIVADNIIDYFEGREPRNKVNK
ncbi:MAG: NAD-binding D-isomer specific 2-hydroxyacid dehydrogenase [Parcubacteria group bacterium Gr01-1014_46]|nr:MAG: NAD-binding D-isomer specific 2-hydroxyacid dehydrogenase [Parcubacteria group bacterium Gr01-1014_46]